MHHTMTAAGPARTVAKRKPVVAVKSDVKTGHDIAYVTRGHASVSTQEAARWLVHCCYWQWRSTQGGKGDFWQAQEDIHIWLVKFYVAARKGLGLESSAVYQDPPEGLPIPGDERKPENQNS